MEAGQPIVRPANDADAPAVLKLMAELGYPDLSPTRFAETYNLVLRHPAITLILAEDADGKVIGLASISRRPQLRLTADLITIDELVVAAGARGRGLGHALLEHVKLMAEQSGARLELETNRARESYHRAFYIKNGFIEANSAVMRIDYHLSESL
jgi:GNAT superfamily N-acetyltransferase